MNPVVLVERPAEGVALVRINRPEARNALNMEVRTLIAQHLTEQADDPAVRCIVLTGNDKAFAAGADIKEMSGLGSIEMLQRGTLKLWRTIAACPKPVIAAVSGFALGGGCELAMTCDIIIAGESARFGQPEVKLGIGHGYGGTVRLPRLVGRGRALELLLTGQMIDAQEALRIGLVNRVVPAERLLEESAQLLRTIFENGPLAVRACLEAVDAGLGMSLDDALLLEANYFGLLSATEDMREGTRAFLEKRKTSFEGK